VLSPPLQSVAAVSATNIQANSIAPRLPTIFLSRGLRCYISNYKNAVEAATKLRHAILS
jgi:hypothetical protein